MSTEEHNLLESVVNITGERDKRSLGLVLVSVLSEFVDFQDVILLLLPQKKDFNVVEQVAAIPKDAAAQRLDIATDRCGDRRVYMDERMLHCIDSCGVVYCSDRGASRVLFPLVVNQKIAGILDLFGAELDASAERIIQGFIRIYCNFIDVLDDSERDALTGLLNRRTFDTRFNELMSSSIIEAGAPPKSVEERRDAEGYKEYWLGLLDIDHFKNINDTHGHLYGDEVLLLFADIMRDTFRLEDMLYRYGGEEFVVILSTASEEEAFRVFERFRKAIDSCEFAKVGNVTVSIGIVKACVTKHPSVVVESADKALYYAKENGRNQVCNFDKLVEAGKVKYRSIEDDIELF